MSQHFLLLLLASSILAFAAAAVTDICENKDVRLQFSPDEYLIAALKGPIEREEIDQI